MLRVLMPRELAATGRCAPGADPRAAKELQQQGLAQALRARTRTLHHRAERSGFVADLIRGRGSQAGYVLFLRNLQPAYATLERGLQAPHLGPHVRGFAWQALARQKSLEEDLERLAGPSWQATLPLLPAGLAYARAVRGAARGDGSRLLAHAYVRYLGDLSGGQVLQRILVRSLGLPTEALTVYDFPAIPDIDRFKADFRVCLDRAGAAAGDLDPILAEAEAAFRCNIELSEAVQTALTPPRRISPAA